MRINQNISAMNTYSRLTSANASKSNSLARLSSGLRINKAGDDAAGLAISEKMRGQVSGLKQAVRNAQDGISLIQTAEGALNETHSILNRMRELAVQAANGTNTDTDRDEIQKEINQLTSEINRIGNTTEFNTQKLLKGGATTGGTPGVPASGTATLGEVEVTVTGEATATDITVTFATGMADDKVKAAWLGNTVTITIGTDALAVDATALNEALANAAGAPADGGDISFSYTGNLTQSDFGTSSISVTGGSAPVAGTGSAEFEAELQIGANSGQSFNLSIGDMRSSALGISGDTASGTKTVTVDGETYNAAWTATADVEGGAEYALDISDHDKATAAIGVIDEAINSVSSERSKLGSVQNRLEHTINNLTATAENLSAAESRIRDVDMAEEMMEFTKNNILSQAATSMLAQANQMPQSVLQLLQ